MSKPRPGGDKPVTPLGDKPTYQDLLDESLEETFPASDPISPSSATERAQRKVTSDKNDIDWKLKPGSEAVVPAAAEDKKPEKTRKPAKGKTPADR